MVVLDNASDDGSFEWLQKKAKEDGALRLLRSDVNIGHGPGLCRCLEEVETPYVFTLDSDTVTIKGGFLELMLRRLETNEQLFALGWLRYVNHNGVAFSEPNPKAIRYVHPHAMLFDFVKYRRLKPFVSAGAPAIKLMTSAAEAGYEVEDFPIQKYIRHLIAGTRRLYRGHWDPRKTKSMRIGPWNPKAQYKI